MLVADGQGPSISYREGPMYVSVYARLFGRGSLIISWQFLNAVFRKQSDLKSGEQMTYSESGQGLAEAIASRLSDRVVARPWLDPGLVPPLCLSFPTMPWLCKVHFGGYFVAREAGSISRSK